MNDDKERLWKLINVLIFIGVAGMVVIVALQVLTRSLGQSLPWTEELTRNLFVLTVFFGMAVGFRNAQHTRINFIIDLVPQKFRKIPLYIYFLSNIIFFLILAYYGFHLSLRQFRSGEFSPGMGIPMYIVTIPIFISAILAIIALLQSVFFDQHTIERLLDLENDDFGSES